MLLFGARLGVLSNVSPTLAKKLVLGRRVFLPALALALRLRTSGLVGELVLELGLHFDVTLILFLLHLVLRELVVEWEAVQVQADLIMHEGHLILIKGGRRERPSTVLALCLFGIVAGPRGTASGRRTTLEDDVLHVVVVAGGRHSVEQVACTRQHVGWLVPRAFPCASG